MAAGIAVEYDRDQMRHSYIALSNALDTCYAWYQRDLCLEIKQLTNVLIRLEGLPNDVELVTELIGYLNGESIADKYASHKALVDDIIDYTYRLGIDIEKWVAMNNKLLIMLTTNYHASTVAHIVDHAAADLQNLVNCIINEPQHRNKEIETLTTDSPISLIWSIPYPVNPSSTDEVLLDYVRGISKSQYDKKLTTTLLSKHRYVGIVEAAKFQYSSLGKLAIIINLLGVISYSVFSSVEEDNMITSLLKSISFYVIIAIGTLVLPWYASYIIKHKLLTHFRLGSHCIYVIDIRRTRTLLIPDHWWAMIIDLTPIESYAFRLSNPPRKRNSSRHREIQI